MEDRGSIICYVYILTNGQKQTLRTLHHRSNVLIQETDNEFLEISGSTKSVKYHDLHLMLKMTKKNACTSEKTPTH